MAKDGKREHRTESDVTGTGAAPGLEVWLRKPGSNIQKLVPSLGATAIIQGGDNKGLNKGDCCGVVRMERDIVKVVVTLVIGWLWRKRERRSKS